MTQTNISVISTTLSVDSLSQQYIQITCPLEAKYCFIKSCSISTCMYYTKETANKCMLLAARTSFMLADTHKISDAELLRWKGKSLDIQDIQEIKNIRHKACRDAQAILILDRYLRFVESKKPFCRIARKRQISMAAHVLENHFPFFISDLFFKPWMGVYLFSEEVYDSFREQVQAKAVTQSDKNNKKNAETPSTSENNQNKETRKTSFNRIKITDFYLYDLCFMDKKKWEECRSQVLSYGTDLFNTVL